MLVKPAALTVAGVYSALRTIAVTKGQGSAQKKQALMKQLISRCRCRPHGPLCSAQHGRGPLEPRHGICAAVDWS